MHHGNGFANNFESNLIYLSFKYMKKEIYPVIGMHCASCKSLIENSVSEVDGVKNVSVNFASEKMNVEYDETETTLERIKEAVSNVGSYKLVTEQKTEMEMNMPGHDHMAMLKEEEFGKIKSSVIWSGIDAIPFLIFMIWMLLFNKNIAMNPMDFFGEISLSNGYAISLFFLIQFALATPILFIAGRAIFQSALTALKVPAANMDTLIAVGTFTAWAFSTVVTFAPSLFSGLKETPEVFFEAAVFIIFFILLGRLLEANAKGKTNSAIQKLLQLQAKEAMVLRDGKFVKVQISEILVGDIILLKPGEKVAVDGIISEGQSTLDESMITGESMPVTKGIGDTVVGGTINKSGSVQYTAQKIGSDTMLSQIIKIVEEAQSSQAPIQKLADKVSSVFVPIVIGISLFSFLFWLFIAPKLGLVDIDTSAFQLAIYIATTVLIIACPCALGLATPTAIMVGSGNGAEKGILLKNAQSLEIAHKIDTLVFDKTGTLTIGRPEVTDFFNLRELNIQELSLIKSVEDISEHPLSKAITGYIETRYKDIKTLKIENFQNNEGMGVEGTFEQSQIIIGNSKLMNKKGLTLSSDVNEKYLKLGNEAKSTAFVALNNEIIAVIGIADIVKEESKEAIQKLHNMKIKTVMLTGDNNQIAQSIARQLGIDKVVAEVLPTQKAQAIDDIKSENPKSIIAMVGDGVNDAPALAKADIGIAMGTGTDVAIESGDIILIKGDLNKLIEAIELSKNTMKVIKQNLFWAFGYNIIGIPIAAGLLYPVLGILLSPIIAGGAMAFSSISVVLNSLRLKNM